MFNSILINFHPEYMNTENVNLDYVIFENKIFLFWLFNKDVQQPVVFGTNLAK